MIHFLFHVGCVPQCSFLAYFLVFFWWLISEHSDRIQAAGCAFAAILANETVVTWGDPAFGGDSSIVQTQLRHVQRLYSTYYAFAAVRSDGSVVTWGDPAFGGNCSRIQDQLRNVEQISGSLGAFVAILSNGSVLSWGSVLYGADARAAQDGLQYVGWCATQIRRVKKSEPLKRSTFFFGQRL